MEEAHNDRQRKQTHGHGGVARYRCPFTIPGRWHARGSGGSVISFLSSGFPRVLAFSLALLDSFSLFAARHLAASFAFLSHVFPVAFH